MASKDKERQRKTMEDNERQRKAEKDRGRQRKTETDKKRQKKTKITKTNQKKTEKETENKQRPDKKTKKTKKKKKKKKNENYKKDKKRQKKHGKEGQTKDKQRTTKLRTSRFLQVSRCDQQSDDRAVFMPTNAEESRGLSQRECVNSVCRLLQSRKTQGNDKHCAITVMVRATHYQQNLSCTVQLS